MSSGLFKTKLCQMNKVTIPFNYNLGTKIVFAVFGLIGLITVYLNYISKGSSNLDRIGGYLFSYIMIQFAFSTFFRKLVFNFRNKEIIVVQGLLIHQTIKTEDIKSCGTKTSSFRSGTSLVVIFKMNDGSCVYTPINPDARKQVLDQITKITGREPKIFSDFRGNFFKDLILMLTP